MSWRTKKNIHIYKLIEIEKNKRTKQKKKIVVSNRKKNKNGTVKSKKGCQLAKGKKSCRHRKGRGVKQQKQNKKNYSLRTTSQRPRCSLPSCASSPPFVPVLVAAVHAGARRRPSCRCSLLPWGRRCWLRSVCGGSRLGAGHRCWVQGLSF